MRAALALVLCAAGLGRAETARATDSAGSEAQFQQGMELLGAQKYPEARRHFQRATEKARSKRWPRPRSWRHGIRSFC